MTGVITAEAAASGSLFERWVGCEAAVGADVGEDLLDGGEHVGVLDPDPVDITPTQAGESTETEVA